MSAFMNKNVNKTSQIRKNYYSNNILITIISSVGFFGNIITNLTMISLKRKTDENEEQDGTPLKCRFLDGSGSCSLHPSKPGVCWLYPFASWLESDSAGRPVPHATFQFTGDCPGFFVADSLDPILPILKDYSHKIYDYNMSVNRTGRETYGCINFINLNA